MKYKVIILLSMFLQHCKTNTGDVKADAINLHSTADQLMLFGEDVISTPLYQRDLAISPQQNELIYTLGDYKQNRRCLVVLNQINDTWTNAKILNISGKYHDIEPFYSNNGNRLYFASNRPIYNDITRDDYNIWYSDRIENGWAEPIALDSIINSRGDEFFPSLSDKGNLFFTATRADGVGREDIFMSEYINNRLTSPKPLPEAINTPKFEFNAYISPKEDLIIFSSFGRSDGFGGGDLYISRKDDLGNWTASKNLGAAINSKTLDYCPFIDWKSGNFYFTSERMTDTNKTLDNVGELNALSNSALNGFGNIFKIGVDHLE